MRFRSWLGTCVGDWENPTPASQIYSQLSIVWISSGFSYNRSIRSLYPGIPNDLLVLFFSSKLRWNPDRITNPCEENRRWNRMGTETINILLKFEAIVRLMVVCWHVPRKKKILFFNLYNHSTNSIGSRLWICWNIRPEKSSPFRFFEYIRQQTCQ